jgi:hypothetical protein
MTDKIKVGSKVMWRGNFGTAAPVEAEIEAIQMVAKGCKFGRYVNSLSWSTIDGRNVVVDLTNGSWAYGNQLSPIEK